MREREREKRKKGCVVECSGVCVTVRCVILVVLVIDLLFWRNEYETYQGS